MNWFLKIARPLPRLLLAASLLLALRPLPVRAQSSGPQYVVQPGDTLYGIALQFGLTVEALQAANPGVDAAALAVGQALVIPGFEGVAGTLSTHLLEPGESLDSLAFRLGLRRETLIRLNHVVNPERMYINESVVVVVDQADAGAAVATGITRAVQAGEGLLAVAASANRNPWALAALNRLPHPGALSPGALVIVPGGDAPTKALPFPLRDLQMHPLPAEQGGALSIRVETMQPLSLTGALGDWPLHFNVDEARPNSQVALLGIYRLADSNLYPLTIAATDSTGATTRFSQALPVRVGDYGSENLNVNPATLDPAVTGPENEQIKSVIAPVTPARFWSGLFALPSVGVIRSWYGTLRAYNNGPYDSFHTGVDFSGGEDRPITAPAPGVVVFAGPLVVRGNATIIDHGWGVYTGYWHQSVIQVNVGDRVESGQIIGYNGATGRVTGPHLHWELWVGGFPVDPLQWTETEFP